MSQVKLILTESVHSLGEAGDLVNVKPGFARNFLLPQGKAILATATRVKELEHHRRIVTEKAAKELNDLQAAKSQIEALSIEISARAGEEGKLFGSVTSSQIAERLAGKGFTIDRRRIDLKDSLKEVGEHSVPVKLHREIVASLTVTIVPDGTPVAEPEEREDPDDREDRRRARDDDDSLDGDDDD